jgi:hypothetical protein
MLSINGSFFFNPEVHGSVALWWGDGTLDENGESMSSTTLLTFVPYFGYNITRNFSVAAGPSVTWVHADNRRFPEPLFSILTREINERNNITLGARASVRYRF